ncbi:MAG: DNA repair protein RecN [Erysipelotrichaceae bacterium]|nr:DNA repair protein RecN [Erysipelotrichaceae bacterium]
MLKSLYIKNYAIIDELNIEFHPFFNVFTGETGAGKSIIVGALSFLIRGKADPGIIKNGQEKAIIEGVFSVDKSMDTLLKEADIEHDGEIIVRRVISRDNHNSIRINEMSVTLNFLSQLFADHIDIHSQKDNQYLLNKRNHLYLLDQYVSDDALFDAYHDTYASYHKLEREFKELNENTYNESELEYYRFDLQELKEAELDVNEEAELLQKEARYKSQEKYIIILSNVLDLYDGDSGIKEKLSTVIKELHINDELIDQVRENVDNIYYQLNDEIDKLKELYATFDEELNIDQIEQRLYNYSRLKRKHDTDVPGLLEKQKQLQEKIDFFLDKDHVLNEKKKELDDAYQKALSIAQMIHEKRSVKAKELEEQIRNQCDDLLLSNVNFQIRIDETELGTHGIDDVEFYIALNKNEEPKPLRNIASGGEISRLMLALKSVFTSISEVFLVIFDEIDTGISGKTALAVGQKIARIAENKQVICITHLPSVAACADAHYYIYKEDDLLETKTKVRRLNREEIIKEIAYISSLDDSPSALEAAEQLYLTAQGAKKHENG